jgi:diaminopimelate decarboxylase
MKIKIEELIKLRNKFGSSYYIFNKDKFIGNYQRFENCFRKYYPDTVIAYAYKSNYMPILGDTVSDLNGRLEVVSDLEYDIAEKSIDQARIVYNGPIKTKESLFKALKGRSIVNIDSLYEIDLIKELLDEKELVSASIGLRVNFKVLDYKSRFGFDIKSDVFYKVLKIIEDDSRINLISLHSHFTTKEKSTEIFSLRTQEMSKLYKKLSPIHQIKYVNIGGGFFGEMPEELKKKFNVNIPSIEEYAKSICLTLIRELDGYKLPTLIIEPGISVVGDTMDLYVEVLEIKKIDGDNIAVCDTSINVTNPTKSSINAPFKIIHKPVDVIVKNNTNRYKLVGNTCMEHDVLCEEFIGECKQGDFLMFMNRGGYSNVYTPPFIMSPPPILSSEGEVYKYRDNCDSILKVYNYKAKI